MRKRSVVYAYLDERHAFIVETKQEEAILTPKGFTSPLHYGSNRAKAPQSYQENATIKAKVSDRSRETQRQIPCVLRASALAKTEIGALKRRKLLWAKVNEDNITGHTERISRLNSNYSLSLSGHGIFFLTQEELKVEKSLSPLCRCF